MYHSCYLKDRRLNVEMQQYLRRHDLVYETPMEKPSDGVPLGTGCFGGLSYVDENALHFCINHIDAVDCARQSDFSTWAWEDEEKTTAAFGCGHLTITDRQPSFDWKYLKDFEYRLNLAEARAELRSQTPFADNRFTAIASVDHQVMEITGTMHSDSETIREISLDRWGSRNFFHYYEQISDCPEKNLGDTETGWKDDCFYVSQIVGENSFVTAVRVFAEHYTIEKVNNHSIRCVLPAGKDVSFRLLVSCVVSGNRTPDVEGALEKLKKAGGLGSRLQEDHRRDWKQYWEKSFLNLPEHDYLENVYYLSLYHLRCSGLGKYPHSFASIWNWYGDSRNWGHFYHWNYQQTYWPMHAAGRPELVENYLEYRFGMLEHAKEVGRKLFGVEGAFFSDVTSLNGYEGLDPDTITNMTCGAQIALCFYKHWLYTGNRKFLKDRAYPFMLAVAELYENVLTKQEDGIYRLPGGATVYEAYWNVKTTITDYCAIRFLFGKLLELSRELEVDEDRREKWQDLLDHLYEMPVTTYEEEGMEPARILSVGEKWDGSMIRWNEGTYPRNVFHAGYEASVYPFNQIGLGDRGTEKFERAMNTEMLRLYGSVNPEKKVKQSIIGHNPALQVSARLGLAETAQWIERFLDQFQSFRNGMCHFMQKGSTAFGMDGKPLMVKKLPKEIQETGWTRMHEKKGDASRIAIDPKHFLHSYYEPTGNIMDALQEMLLQSYDGVIRVFPAVYPGFSGTFSLWARGNFRISAQMEKGELLFILVEAFDAGECRVEVPFSHARLICEDRRHGDFRLEGSCMVFSAEKGQSYLIESVENPLTQLYEEKIHSWINNSPKQLGDRILGSFRNF